MSKTIVADNGDTIEVHIYEAGVELVGSINTVNGEIVNGTGVPSPAIGEDGDYYHRLDTKELYGPKTGGVWPSDRVQLSSKLMVGDTEILKKGTGNTNLEAVENGDIVRFYDSSNDNRKVEGVVVDYTDYTAYTAANDKYDNLLTYVNQKPS